MIRRYCRKLVVLPRQAQNTSSTEIIRRMINANPDVFGQLAQKETGDA
ncbi:MAG: hypothetical protein AAB476_01405 [Patescibacteria group bacterium]